MAFNSILGHDRPIAILKKAVARKTLPHSIIFEGGEGIGKLMTAMELAKLVTCEKKESEPCDTCSSCLKVISKNHPDIRLIDGSFETIGVEQIRVSQQWLSLKAYEGGKKILIIDKAESMTTQASNAFLKTLEEPQGDALLIIISHNIQALLPTIISRCQLIKFNPLTSLAITKILIESYSVPKEAATVIADLSHGGLGRAISFFHADILSDRNLVVDLLLSAANDNIEKVGNILKSILKKNEKSNEKSNGIDSDETVTQLASNAFLKTIMDLFEEIFRDIAVFSGTNGNCRLLNSDIPDKIGAFTKIFTINEALDAFDLIEQSRKAIDRNLNKQLVLETMLLRLGDNSDISKRSS